MQNFDVQNANLFTKYDLKAQKRQTTTFTVELQSLKQTRDHEN